MDPCRYTPAPSFRLRAAALAWVLALPSPLLRAGAIEEFSEQIRPVLQKHCFECHGPEKHKGDLNLADFTDLEKVTNAPEVWQLVLERLQSFEMPPEGKNELGFDKHQRLIKWLRGLPKPPNVDCEKIASDRTANFYRGYVMSRRLNRAEYTYTIRDLFGIHLDLSDLLPADGGGGEGFDTSGNALFTSSIHIEKYFAAAERVVQAVLPDNPQSLAPEFKAARERILRGRAAPGRSGARETAREIIARLSRAAFRRPVSAEEQQKILGMYDRAAARGESFLPSLRLAVKAILVSPNFLFLVEPEPEEKGVQPLGPFPLASRLSYFLWSSMPDAELFALAQSGELLNTNVYQRQIHRMLADPKADALGERFALQWLEVERLGGEVRPDPKKFPEFDAALQKSMRGEVAAFFNSIFRSDRPLPELIDADFTFVDERLARIYGLPGVSGEAMRRVSLPNHDRGGVLGMAAVHALTSFPLRSSPVLRGRWVLEALLGEKVPPPPPDVPALEEHSEKNANLSLREQLQTHRTKGECAACHDKMDPLGFGLENFDALGRWRDTDRGQPIDARGTLPSGESFTGPAGLKKILMGRKDDVIRHLVRKMIGYAYGRELNRFDDCVVDRTMEALQKNNYRPSVLVEQIALSFPFRHRFYPKQT